jgi:hypothetical protein
MHPSLKAWRLRTAEGQACLPSQLPVRAALHATTTRSAHDSDSNSNSTACLFA